MELTQPQMQQLKPMCQQKTGKKCIADSIAESIYTVMQCRQLLMLLSQHKKTQNDE